MALPQVWSRHAQAHTGEQNPAGPAPLHSPSVLQTAWEPPAEAGALYSLAAEDAILGGRSGNTACVWMRAALISTARRRTLRCSPCRRPRLSASLCVGHGFPVTKRAARLSHRYPLSTPRMGSAGKSSKRSDLTQGKTTLRIAYPKGLEYFHRLY